jgi:hypothetical protein
MENLGVAKLLINLRDGILDVQGSEDFVRSIYQDFKEQVAKSAIAVRAPVAALSAAVQEMPESGEQSPRRRKVARASTQNDKSKATEYKPSFNPQLNLNGLEEWYGRFEPANYSEKILLFAIFLRDHLNARPCNADDIFTCFQTLRSLTKTPEAFVQAFRDAQSRTHFIEYLSPENIEVTIAGENHFNHKLKRKEGASK